MRRSTIAAALLAVLVVGSVVVVFSVAGVGPFDADGDDAGGGPNATESASAGYLNVTVRGGDLGADADVLFAETAETMNRSPNELDVPDVSIEPMGLGPHPLTGLSFQQLLLLDDPDRELPSSSGTAEAEAQLVRVNEDRLKALQSGGDGVTIDQLLVHEFAHVVQIQSSFLERHQRRIQRTDPSRRTTHDQWTTLSSVSEGGAEFVANEHADGAVLDRWNRRWPDMEPQERLVRWPYYRGAQWADARFERPGAQLELDRTPRRTVTILRRDAPTERSPTISLSANLSDASVEHRDRLGAVTVDVALSSQLPVDRSRRVAAGLRTDEYRLFERDGGDRPGHVWVTNYRNRSAAADFEAAIEAYLDARGERTGEHWTGVANRTAAVERTNATTVTLLVGDEEFVRRTTVVADDGAFTVTENGSAEVTAPRVASSARVDASPQSVAIGGA